MSDHSEGQTYTLGFIAMSSPSSAHQNFGTLLQKITTLLVMKGWQIDKPQDSSFNIY